MKTQLTKEQSQHLIDLGIDKYKASEVEHEGAGNETHKYVYFFTLTDLLEILPNNIGQRNRIVESGERGHFAYYCGANGSLGWKSAKDELIDALYELTCWCIENKKLKL